VEVAAAEAAEARAKARAKARAMMLEPRTNTFTYQDVLADSKLNKIIYSI
jgi:hypothetical protein